MSETVTTEKLYADLQAVVRDAEALLKATAGYVGTAANDKVEEARNRAQESIKLARGRLETIEQDALQRAKEVATAAEDYVRDNPWQSLGVAAGVGLLLGMLLSRRS